MPAITCLRQMPSMLGILILVTCTGCGAGHLARKSSFAFHDPAVSWVYKTGWQVVVVGHPLPPMAMPLGNAVRRMDVRDGTIFVYEDASGDFGRGSYFPVVCLELETGKVIPQDRRTEQLPGVEGKMQSCKAGEVVRITEGRFFSWEQNGSLELYIRKDASHEYPSKVFERNGFGYVNGWLYVAEQNCLLVAAVGQRPLSLWDADSYIIRIDLEYFDFDDARHVDG